MTKMVLLITNKEDITTDFIVNELNDRGIGYYRFNTEDFPSKINLSLNFKNKIFKIIDFDYKRVIKIKDIISVYFRRPKISEIRRGFNTEGEKKFLKSEIAFTLEGIYKLLENKFWINPIFPIREAENKIYQLKIAKEVGFKIPPSIFTNDIKDAKEFILDNENDCVIKPIRSGLIDDLEKPKIIFTSLLTDKQINSLNRVRLCPTFIQKKISKIADIRITVVGNKVFAALIDSQAFNETEIDWRKGENIPLKYKKYKLPYDIEEKCKSLTKKLNLIFSAIDLILSKKKEFIFLEINPNGQWAWIEKKLNYAISKEIVNLLIEK